MIVRVLGSAAGGGVPQWNCACKNCSAARDGRLPHRTQSSLAISPDGERWLLLNCSPDVAAQIEAFPALHPSPLHGSPVDGILLTDANVDHVGGLAVLRQRRGDAGFRVRSSPVVRAIATAQTAFAPFDAPPHRWLDVPLDTDCEPDAESDVIGNSLFVRALVVPGTTPGYDGRRTVRGAVVAYEIVNPTRDKRVLFAPVFSAIDGELGDAIARSAVAFLDGTFYTDDELQTARLLDKSARVLGHLPVGDPGGTLDQLPAVRGRVIFTHLNNSNPMLDPQSAAFARILETGAELACDGMELRL